MKQIKKWIRKIQYAIRDLLINRKNRKRLINTDFSVISNDCTGGGICHDLHLRFQSPTVNFFFSASDYVSYLTKLHEYTHDYEIEEVIGETYQDKPIARIVLKNGEFVTAYLLHYDSVEEFREKYKDRSSRINWDNLFILFNDRNDFSPQNLIDFDRLPYANKVCFVHERIDGVGCQFFIPGKENRKEVDPMMNYVHTFGIKRFYDYFDYVSWFNREKSESTEGK